MKSFSVTVNIWNMPTAYTTHNVRNIVDNALTDGGPWKDDDITIHVQELHEIPDLTSVDPLGSTDLEALEELRETLLLQRDSLSAVLLRIAHRISTTYPSAKEKEGDNE